MNRITARLKKQKKFLFFLLTNIGLLFIYSQNTDRSGYVYAATVGKLSKYIASSQSKVLAYLNLQKANDILRQENERLRNLNNQNIISTHIDSTSLYGYHTYLGYRHSAPLNIRLDTVYRWLCTNVIQRINRVGKTFIVINSGIHHGAEEGMLVAGSNGIVGTISKAYPESALVMTMYHEHFRLAAKVRANGSSGILVWDPNIPRKMLLQDIPASDHIWIGDTVFSSHLSLLAPSNIPIGRVQKIQYDRKDILKLTIEPIEKLQNLYTAYVIIPKYNKQHNMLLDTSP